MMREGHHQPTPQIQRSKNSVNVHLCPFTNCFFLYFGPSPFITLLHSEERKRSGNKDSSSSFRNLSFLSGSKPTRTTLALRIKK